MCLRGQGRSVKNENTHVKIGIFLIYEMYNIVVVVLHSPTHTHTHTCDNF